MAKAKKATATADAPEKSALEHLQDELAHWEKYLKDQGIDDSSDHLYKQRVQNIRDEIAELS